MQFAPAARLLVPFPLSRGGQKPNQGANKWRDSASPSLWLWLLSLLMQSLSVDIKPASPVVEFRPLVNSRESECIESKALGRTVALKELSRMGDDYIDSLFEEITEILQELNAAIEDAKLDRLEGNPMPALEFAKLSNTRKKYGRFYQAIINLRRKRRINSSGADVMDSAPRAAKLSKTTLESLARHFQQVARCELDPVTYQRLYLAAEMRLAARSH